jgi:uncharacterized protein YoxC|tara:strand:- start:201 stop:383 length:183 start_codon:yes stop_codon:yes gene_type:complete
MIIRDMNLSLIISCILIVIALIILPLIISYKAEKKDKNINEWEKIKKFGENINDETRNKH